MPSSTVHVIHIGKPAIPTHRLRLERIHPRQRPSRAHDLTPHFWDACSDQQRCSITMSSVHASPSPRVRARAQRFARAHSQREPHHVPLSLSLSLSLSLRPLSLSVCLSFGMCVCLSVRLPPFPPCVCVCVNRPDLSLRCLRFTCRV